MNRNFIKVRRLMARRFSIVLPVLVEDLFEAVSVDGTDLATVSITDSLNVLN